jgi:hypothetical protein
MRSNTGLAKKEGFLMAEEEKVDGGEEKKMDEAGVGRRSSNAIEASAVHGLELPVTGL